MHEQNWWATVGVLVVALTLVTPTPASAVPPGTTEVKGEVGGALYALYVPASWNGDLIMYSHGYLAPLDPIQLPDDPHPFGDISALRDELLVAGYAMAMSSYSTNGWAVQEGFFETRHLRPLFISHFGQPSHIYLMGQSMGGLIALRLAEKHPGLFDGALPMCGVVGGGQMLWDFVYDTRVLFDYLFPEVDLGDPFDVPEWLLLDGLGAYFAVYFAALPAMCPNDFPDCFDPDPRVLELAGIDQVEIPYDQPSEAAYSILLPLWGQVIGAPDLLERTNGKLFFDNSTIWYTGSTNDAALNAGVDRFRSRPPAFNYFRRWYEPTGKLRIPMLTLHTTRDGLVLNTQEVAYAQQVAEQGYADNLVQRTFDRYDHCTFTVDEMVQALMELENWAENGIKPTP